MTSDYWSHRLIKKMLRKCITPVWTLSSRVSDLGNCYVTFMWKDFLSIPTLTDQSIDTNTEVLKEANLIRPYPIPSALKLLFNSLQVKLHNLLQKSYYHYYGYCIYSCSPLYSVTGHINTIQSDAFIIPCDLKQEIPVSLSVLSRKNIYISRIQEWDAIHYQELDMIKWHYTV